MFVSSFLSVAFRMLRLSDRRVVPGTNDKDGLLSVSLAERDMTSRLPVLSFALFVRASNKHGC